MAAANLWALLVRGHAWAGMYASTVVVLSLILQGRVDVWRDTAEASAACLAWGALTLAVIWQQARALVRS